MVGAGGLGSLSRDRSIVTVSKKYSLSRNLYNQDGRNILRPYEIQTGTQNIRLTQNNLLFMVVELCAFLETVWDNFFLSQD